MRNSSYEQALKKAGVNFAYEEGILVEDINVTRGKQLQARLQPIDDDLVESYAKMTEEGFEPPPLVLWKHGKSKLTPLDGNQRLAANDRVSAKNKKKSFSAYVVSEEDPMVAERLCWQFNNMVNGRRLTYEESIRHAITFVRKYGQPVHATARDWGVKGWELESRCRELDIRDVGGKKGIDSSKIATGTVLALNPLMKVGEDILAKALKTVVDSGVGHAAVTEMVSDVGKARTMDAKLEIVDSFSKSAKVIQAKSSTKGGKLVVRNGQMARDKLQKHLNQMEDLLNEYDADAFKPGSKADRERFSGAALVVCNKLITIYGLGSLLKGQSVPQ